MKTKYFIKEVWKQNKWDYLISCVILTLGCFFLYGIIGSPLEYSIPFSIGGSFILMYGTAFLIGGEE